MRSSVAAETGGESGCDAVSGFQQSSHHKWNLTSQRYTGDNLRYYVSGIDEVIRYRTPSPLVTMCQALFRISWVTAAWISRNFTAPLGLIALICKMPQEGDGSHRAVQPSKVLLKFNYRQPRYCAWHLYRRTGAEPEALRRIYCGGVGENECALISFQKLALLSERSDSRHASLRNVSSVYLGGINK